MIDKRKAAGYAAEAKERWSGTQAYRAYETKAEGRSEAEQQVLGERLMDRFCAFGTMRGLDPASDAAQAKVKELQAFITENYYLCTDELLYGLGQMYEADERFRENIDSAGGEGTAAFVKRAIEAYCKRA